MLHEIDEPDKEGLWFKFGDAKIRFSVMEFALISGLKCYGDADLEHFIVAGSTNQLKDIYFKEFAASTRRSEVEVVFDKAKFKSDDDAVKLALFYLISCFILVTVRDKLISLDYFKLIDNNRLADFNLGKLAYDGIVESLRATSNSILKRDYTDDKESGPSYKLAGLLVVFQFWAYECIKSVRDTFAINVSNTVFPRILRWKVEKLTSNNTLDAAIYNNDQVFCCCFP